MKIKLTSADRYNGGVKIKRMYGSSCVTHSWVEVDGKLQKDKVVGYGKTPGERKTFAKERFLSTYAGAVIES